MRALVGIGPRIAFALGLIAVACSGDPTPRSSPTSPSGGGGAVPAIDPSFLPEVAVGNAPLIIIAPHGGDLTPATLPDRTCSGCETVNDLNTQDLARLVAAAFARRTGRSPTLVLNRLHRRKFDANRDVAEATGSYAALDTVWRAFHAAIDTARATIVRSTGRGLVVDLHGHAHTVQRLELGFLLSAASLRLGDSALNASGALRQVSIARLATDNQSGVTAIDLLRGSASLGALLTRSGYPAVPSPTDPAPLSGESYFDGGYNTQRHGSATGGNTDAIQIECNFTGIRDTAASRSAFAEVLAAALEKLLRDQYGWRP